MNNTFKQSDFTVYKGEEKSYKYPHSLHNVTAKQIEEKKEGAEVKENERERCR